MQLETAKLLEAIRIAASDAIQMTAQKSFDDFVSDKQLRYAVEWCFEIAGEALSQLNKFDPPTAQSIRDWRAIIGFRNVLIHGYSVVQHDKTWDIVISELPMLPEDVIRLLGSGG